MNLLFQLARAGSRIESLLGEILSALRELAGLHKPLPAYQADYGNRPGRGEEEWISHLEAAELLSVTTKTVFRYKKRGLLRSCRIGRNDYYRKSDIFRLQ